MKAFWLRLATRYAAFSRRERLLVALAAIGGTLVLGLALLVDPVVTRNRALRQNIDRQGVELTGIQGQLLLLEAEAKRDPDAARKAEIQGLQTTLQELGQRLETLQGGLVRPEQMNGVLETLLKRHPGLRLVSLKTLPPSGLLASRAGKGDEKTAAAAKAEENDFDLYRHGVELRLEGSYRDLSAYVGQLEQAPQKFLWGEGRLAVDEHPRAILTLVVYTLSSDKAWLAI